MRQEGPTEGLEHNGLFSLAERSGHIQCHGETPKDFSRGLTKCCFKILIPHRSMRYGLYEIRTVADFLVRKLNYNNPEDR